MSLRVFELAKELNIPTKELIKKINGLGIKISGNFATLTVEQIADIKKDFLQPAKKSKKLVTATVEVPIKVRRRIISVKKVQDAKKEKKVTKVEKEALKKDQEKKKEVAAVKKETEVKVKEAKTPRKIIKKKIAADIKAADPDMLQEEPIKAEQEVADKVKEKAAEKVKKKAVKVKTTESKEKTEEIEAKETVIVSKRKTKQKAEEEITAKLKEEKIEAPKGRVRKKEQIVDKKPEIKKVPEKIDKKGLIIERVPAEPAKIKKVPQISEPINREIERDESGKVITGFDKKGIKAQPKKEKFKISGGFSAERFEDLEEENLGFQKKKKYISKRQAAKLERRKERAKKKTVSKVKHTFNPRQKELIVGEFISVGDLAGLIGIKVPEIIKTLMSLGIMATITQAIDGETASIVAAEHDKEIKVDIQSIEDSIDQIEDKEENAVLRAPVVTIMGHVDHGKTSLLDKIRSTNVTSIELGGITQHIGAYHVTTKEGEITFLDTPGHEAFTAMRARGADVTDIVVLVVAADDGPKPQTIEAINHAKAGDAEIIVAINKCDKPDANPERTKQQLMEHGLVPEEFGGNVPMIKVSAKNGDGISKLLELIQLQAEIMELKADPRRMAQGVVIESRVDRGRGNSATILIQTGTLKIGDNYVVGTEYGRVRAMWNDCGKKIKTAPPSVPVEIVGLKGIPKAGDQFNVGEDEKQVRQIANLRFQKEKEKKQALQQKKTLENLFDSMGKAEKSILNLVVKTDVIGSLEAITDALERLGNDQVAIRIIHGAVGAITGNDIMLAATSEGVVIGFNTRPDASAKRLAQEENVDIRLYGVIYEAIEDMRKALEGMLEPVIREEIQGKAQVLEIFNIPKVGIIAGSRVTEGKFVRDCPVRIIRDNVIIHNGKLASLRRFKDAAKEVANGQECGIGIESYKDIKVGDELESYLKLETAAKL